MMNTPQNQSPSQTPAPNKTQMETIGSGALGGKAQGLAMMNDILVADFNPEEFPDFDISIPKMTVLRSDVFDDFIHHNQLSEILHSDLPDDRIALKFQQADLPIEILGDLRSIINETHLPLAVRSSSLLEDRSHEPFAGIYGTKIIPNNQFDTNTRFRRLIEAIKFVYASTYFQSARDYMKITQHNPEDEKMAVIIQRVIGSKHSSRFYPEISGVARSYNFYPMDREAHQEGIVHLALGLGKTIVDGGISWSYSPAHPKVKPPYRTVDELLRLSQTLFWAVNLGEPPEYNPTVETEYLVREDLVTAENDGVLPYLASTYDLHANRLTIGTGSKGPRVLTFGRILVLNEIPLNALIKRLLSICEAALSGPVEIEFALTLESKNFGFLQVRPLVVSESEIALPEEDLRGTEVLLASKNVLGNGINQEIRDILYIPPQKFQPEHTRKIAQELETLNRRLVDDGRPYLLIVFGRLGTTDPWLGIPIRWEGVSGAKAVVETTKEDFNIVLSQGSHYFHNLVNLGIHYFSISHASEHTIDWDWLEKRELIEQKDFIHHVRVPEPLLIKVDGRSGRGVVYKPGE